MKIMTLSILATCATIAANGAAWAGDVNYAMPSEDNDSLNPKLIHMDFHGVRVIDETTNNLVAFDYDDGEATLVVHPNNCTISS